MNDRQKYYLAAKAEYDKVKKEYDTYLDQLFKEYGIDDDNPADKDIPVIIDIDTKAMQASGYMDAFDTLAHAETMLLSWGCQVIRDQFPEEFEKNNLDLIFEEFRYLPSVRHKAINIILNLSA